MSKWYRVKLRDILSHGGRSILEYYNSSIFDMLCTVYPEVEWLPWQFSRLPTSMRAQGDLLNQAIKYAEKTLGITEPKTWRRVGSDQLAQLGIAKVISSHGGLMNALKRVYPNESWDGISLSS